MSREDQAPWNSLFASTFVVEHRAQVADLGALARDEAKFFQSLPQKGPNVLFAVGDTYARRDFSPAERGEPSRFVGFLVFHDALHHHRERMSRCSDGKVMELHEEARLNSG
jgi:hypothetical protein